MAQHGSRNIADITDTFGHLDVFKRHGGKLLTFVGANDQLKAVALQRATSQMAATRTPHSLSGTVPTHGDASQLYDPGRGARHIAPKRSSPRSKLHCAEQRNLDQMDVQLEKPAFCREREFLAAVRRSHAFLRQWAAAPSTSTAYRAYVRRSRMPTHQARFVILRTSGALIGVVNLNEIVRGRFQSAYLGYYAFPPHVGQGYMTQALRLTLQWAFGPLRLHRVEANIQPQNRRSLALVRRLGFRREGYSPRYLKIGNRWRDHERWALLAEDWLLRRSRLEA